MSADHTSTGGMRPQESTITTMHCPTFMDYRERNAVQNAAKSARLLDACSLDIVIIVPNFYLGIDSLSLCFCIFLRGRA